jgi:hypothetical protein
MFKDLLKLFLLDIDDQWLKNHLCLTIFDRIRKPFWLYFINLSDLSKDNNFYNNQKVSILEIIKISLWRIN